MSKQPNSRNNTANRIIDASLHLFNEQGERNISTNHIANHMGISPGNLYYHFANKDEIIVQLFKRYSAELFEYLSEVTPDSLSEVSAIFNYMAGIYDVMWRYRFLFSDVNALLLRSATLLGEHNDFTRVRIAPLLVRLLEYMEENHLIKVDIIGKEDLAINIWLITKYWFDFDYSMQIQQKISEQTKQRGVYRSLSLLRPYVLPEYVAEFDEHMTALKVQL